MPVGYRVSAELCPQDHLDQLSLPPLQGRRGWFGNAPSRSYPEQTGQKLSLPLSWKDAPRRFLPYVLGTQGKARWELIPHLL